MALTLVPYSSTITATLVTATGAIVGGYTTATGVTAAITELVVSNSATSGGGATIDVMKYNGTSNFYWLRSAKLPAGGAISIVGGDRPVMASGYQVRVVTSATSAPVDVNMSLTEFTA